MQKPQFIPVQFLDASALNAALDTLFNDDALINSILFTPGVVNPIMAMFSTAGLLVAVDIPPPFAIVSSAGILAQAHGTVNNGDSSSYQVDLTPLLPSTGTATAYIIATITQIYQNPFVVTGPPSGHPDYNPTYSPSQQQATLQYSLAVSASLTAPNNIDAFLLGEYTLNPGQTTLVPINTLNQLPAAVNVPMAAMNLNTIRMNAFVMNPTENETLLIYAQPFPSSIAENFPVSAATCLTPPTYQATYQINYYPVNTNSKSVIGTIIFNAGAYSGVISGPGALLNAGDRITLTGPATQDSTLAGVAINLVSNIAMSMA